MQYNTLAEQEYNRTRGLSAFNINYPHTTRANQHAKVLVFADGSRLRISRTSNSIAFSDGNFYYAVRTLFV